MKAGHPKIRNTKCENTKCQAKRALPCITLRSRISLGVMASCDLGSAKSKSRRRRDRLRRTAILQSKVKSDNLKQMLFTPQEYGLHPCSILGWDPSAFMFQPCQWERGSLNPEVLLGALSEIQVDLDVRLPVPHRRELRDTCSHTEYLRTPATPLGRTGRRKRR